MRPSAKRDDGRLRLVLYDLKHRRYYEDVHKLVARAFVPGETDEKRFACHRNGVPTDNLATNLYWGTPRDNSLDRSRHGTNHNQVKTHCPRGHLLESPNLQAAKLRLGFRSCKACHQARSDMYNGHLGTLQELSDKRYDRLGH